MVHLNVVAVVALTKRFAREVVARGSGRILITSSIAGLAPSPKLNVYPATKAFEFAFAEGLANELQDTGVTVTALLPGETDTEFFRRVGMEESPIGRSKRADPADIARRLCRDDEGQGPRARPVHHQATCGTHKRAAGERDHRDGAAGVAKIPS